MAVDNQNMDGLNMPYSLESEQSVLGALLLQPTVFNYQSLEGFRPEFFHLPEHQAIFDVISRKAMLSERIDLVTVLESLRGEGLFEGNDGKAYLLKISEFVPTLHNVDNYAKIVREKFEARSLINVSREIIDEAMDPGADVGQLLDMAAQNIYNIAQGRQAGGLISVKDAIAESYETFNKLASDERDQYIGIPTGIGPLDNITGGLNRSDLIIVGARPGMGKTSYALSVARHVALNTGKKVAFFALEMSREQLVNRMLSGEAKVNAKKLRTGNLTADEWTRMAQAAGRLCEAPLYFDDTSNITVPEMKARLMRLGKVDFVLVDYLQLMQSHKRTENRVQEVSDITRNLKMLAKDLHVPVMVAAQLSRGTERTASHRPALADLRESGSIEQDADQVLFLFRKAYYDNGENPAEVDNSTTDVIVAKNRHGELDTVEVAWNAEFTQFTALDSAHSMPPPF